jgi:hypothetical protein
MGGMIVVVIVVMSQFDVELGRPLTLALHVLRPEFVLACNA